MNGAEWMERLLNCEQARKQIPLGLQATLALPGRKGGHTAECWYYRMDVGADGLQVYSPERYALWDVRTMKMLAGRTMTASLLGSGADLLTKAHREREDTFLNGLLTSFLNGRAIDQAETTDAWLAAAPQALRSWLEDELKGEA